MKQPIQWFEELTAIPRASGEEERVCDYLEAFAKERNLAFRRDKWNNAVIKKPASPGSTGDTLMLQAHLDIVPVKDEGVEHDFSRDPVKLIKEGDIWRADGTTLGADNGLGIAMILALLDDDSAVHPDLECVFTAEEETGMFGALALDASRLSGKYFINMDSEEDGIFCASCAGGLTVKVRLPLQRIASASLPGAAEREYIAVTVGGLKGGHSGVEIDKQRGNANRLLGRVLGDLAKRFAVFAADVCGGHADNAIPVSASATLSVRREDKAALTARLEELTATFRNELKSSDGAPDAEGRSFSVLAAAAPVPASETVFSEAAFKQVLLGLNLLPNGVAAMALDMPGLVETSSNLGVVVTRGEHMLFTVSVRSSLASRLEALVDQIDLLAGSMGAVMEAGAGYPAWEYRRTSPLRQIFQTAYARVYPGKEAKVEGIHAGLECGVFDSKFRALGRDVDLISIGPDVRGAHTPEESIDIGSAARTWELLKEALKIIATEGRGK